MSKEWADTICAMDSPRVGFRRAAWVSWTLTGIGIASVAGASALAYSDTVKPPLAEASILVGEPGPNTAPQLPDVPSIIDDAASDSEFGAASAPVAPRAAPVAPSMAPVTSAPVSSGPPPEVPVPRSPQAYSPTSEPTATLHPPAPAPTTKVQNGFPIRQSHTPAGGGSSTNKFTPHTVSRGS